MPIVQAQSDLHSSPQKLSKIETLRLARNYILAMAQTLEEGKPMELIRFVKILSRELSQTTANLLNGTLTGSVHNGLATYRRCLTGEFSDTAIQNHQNVSNSPYINSEWHDYCINTNLAGADYNSWCSNYRCDSYKHGANYLNKPATNSLRIFDNSCVATNSCKYDNYYAKSLFAVEYG